MGLRLQWIFVPLDPFGGGGVDVVSVSAFVLSRP